MLFTFPLPFASDIILGLKEKSIKDKKKVFLQSNRILVAESHQIIKDVSIYNMSGQLVQEKSGIFSSNYTLKLNDPGIYLVHHQSSRINHSHPTMTWRPE